MSKLGYINNSYGSQFNIAIANTYAYNVLNGSNLPINSLIISSPVNENNNDIGTYSLIATDNYGNPVRLTYTIKESNGLIYTDDYIKLNIDENTIIEKNNNISVDLNSIIDNKTIKSNESSLYIDYNELTKLDTDKKGLFTIDNKTIKSDDGKLFVDTSKLLYANNGTAAGICIGDGKLINTNQGKVSLNQNNLQKATEEDYGIIHSMNNQVTINNGIISVNTDYLDTCNGDNFGIVIPDNNTIKINENQELYIDTNNLAKVNSTSPGIFKYDENVFEIIGDNKLSIKNMDLISNEFNNIEDKIIEVENKIADIDYLLTQYIAELDKPKIFDFHCASLLSSVLEKPYELNEQVEDMEYQFITVDFIIATNCPFNISLKFEDNIDPHIALYEINYNDSHIYKGNEGLVETYQTTQEEKVPIRLTFVCKNYYKDDPKEYSISTKAKITVSYINDTSINKYIIFSIVRFNSAYNEEIVYTDRNL